MNVTYFLAFGHGLLAFFSPCILPVLPLYFGYLAGETTKDESKKKLNLKLMLNAVGFVLGLSIINILLGFGAHALTATLNQYSDMLRIAGGILLIFFGITFIFDFSFKVLEKERRFQYKGYSPTFLKSLILGFTFSFGWTACNGPIIASILFISGFEKDYWRAGSLMLTYSLGFAMLFLFAAAMFSLFAAKMKGLYKYFGLIKKVSGVLILLMGILLILDKVNILAL